MKITVIFQVHLNVTGANHMHCFPFYHREHLQWLKICQNNIPKQSYP